MGVRKNRSDPTLDAPVAAETVGEHQCRSSFSIDLYFISSLPGNNVYRRALPANSARSRYASGLLAE